LPAAVAAAPATSIQEFLSTPILLPRVRAPRRARSWLRHRLCRARGAPAAPPLAAPLEPLQVTRAWVLDWLFPGVTPARTDLNGLCSIGWALPRPSTVLPRVRTQRRTSQT